MAGADRGRDLQFRVLSDVSQLDLREPAEDLDRLGKAGDTAGRKLDDALDKGGRAVGKLEDQARTTARRVVTAFDDIADAARKKMRAVEDDVDDAGKGLDEFKDEAASSGREAAASFGGGFDDISDLIQETAANAFGGFGPLGAAAGIAAAAGIGVITSVFQKSNEKAEEAKQRVNDWVDAFVEGQGRISAATVDAKLEEILGDREQYEEIIRLTKEAGVSAEVYARALAGDADAAREVKEQIIAQQRALISNTGATGKSASAAANQAVQLQRVAEKLGIATGEIGQARDQWKLLQEATRAGITANVKVNAPSGKELDAINKRIRDGIGTIPVQLRTAGTPIHANTTNNDRYRW